MSYHQDAINPGKKFGPGLVVHSDRGSQYCSDDYQSLLRFFGCTSSMSRKGNCWDNAVVESFFGSMKTEHVYFTKFKSREEAIQSIFEWIEVFYNRKRLHSTLGFCSPELYEKQIDNRKRLHSTLGFCSPELYEKQIDAA